MAAEDPSPDRTSIKNWAQDDRPREKLMKQGAAVLTDAELLAILIRSGTTKASALDVARNILDQAGNDLHRLGRLSVRDLMKAKGMGQAKAVGIAAALELGRRRRNAEGTVRPLVATSAAAYEEVRTVLGEQPHEEFWLLVLDRGNRLVERLCVSRGGMHGTVADPKIIFKEAIDRRASSLVLCHNHPSGQLRPSEEDIRLTRKLLDGGQLLDIGILDHLIVTATGYFSFADNGMLR